MRRFALIALMLALIGCEPTDTPGPPPTVGLENPKSLATVYLSPTSPSTPTPNPANLPAARGTATPTLTPYVGSFLGASEDIPVEGTVATPRPPPPTQPAPDSPPEQCTTAPAAPFEAAWNRNAALREQLGCPAGAGFALQLVHQPFEHGHMFYRDTGDIYALSLQNSPTDIYWRIADTWQESQPESDPNLTPPDGMLQPVRGFGNVWRTNPPVREALGWAIDGEKWIDSLWQDYEGGWMMVGAGGVVFAFGAPGADGTGIHFGAMGGG